MSRVRTHGAELAEIEKPRGSRTAPGRTKGLEENGAGLQVEEEESVIFSNIEVRVRRAGLGDLDVTEYIARIRSGRRGRSRERTAHLSTCQRPKQDSCLTNSSLHCFIVPLTC